MRTLGITIAFVVIFAILGVVGTFVWLHRATAYTATAILEVRPEAGTAGPSAPSIVSVDCLRGLTTKYALLIQSEPVLQTALASQEVRATAWFQQSPDDALLRLRRSIEVHPVEDSGMIRVSMRGGNKNEIADIVNAVAQAARDRAMEIANRGIQGQIRQLQSERKDLVEQRDRVRESEAGLVREVPDTDLLGRYNVLNSDMQKLTLQISELELQLAQADAQLEQLEEQVKSGEVAMQPAVQQALDLDPNMRAMTGRLLILKAAITTTQSDKAAQVGLERDAAALEKEIAARKRMLVERQAKSMVANAKANKSIIRKRLIQLRDKYRSTDARVRALQATITAYNQAAQRGEVLTSQIGRIDTRLTDLRTDMQGNQPLEVMQMASTPSQPARLRLELLDIGGGVGAGVGLLLGLLVSLFVWLGRRRPGAAGEQSNPYA